MINRYTYRVDDGTPVGEVGLGEAGCLDDGRWGWLGDFLSAPITNSPNCDVTKDGQVAGSIHIVTTGELDLCLTVDFHLELKYQGRVNHL